MEHKQLTVLLHLPPNLLPRLNVLALLIQPLLRLAQYKKELAENVIVHVMLHFIVRAQEVVHLELAQMRLEIVVLYPLVLVLIHTQYQEFQLLLTVIRHVVIT